MKINKSTPPANEFIRECDKIHEINTNKGIRCVSFFYKGRNYMLFENGNFYQSDNSGVFKPVLKKDRFWYGEQKKYYRLHPHGFYEKHTTMDIWCDAVIWAFFGPYDLPDSFSIYHIDNIPEHVRADNLCIDYLRRTDKIHAQPCVVVDLMLDEIIGVYSSVKNACDSVGCATNSAWACIRGARDPKRSRTGYYFYKIPHEVYRAYVLEGREVKMSDRIMA